MTVRAVSQLRRSEPRHRQGRLWGLACSAVLTVALTGCSGPRGGLPFHSITQDVGSCAAVLPLARSTVGNRGTLIAIHPLVKGQGDSIIRATGQTPAPHPSKVKSAPSATPSPRAQGVPKDCVVAYRGPYRLGELPLAPEGHGDYAIVILSVRHPAVRRLLLTDHRPAGV